MASEHAPQHLRWRLTLLVGALVAALGWLGAWLDPWLAALLMLVTWVWVTGGLHLDGLGDLADGSRHGRGR